jgi:hypothetical protein
MEAEIMGTTLSKTQAPEPKPVVKHHVPWLRVAGVLATVMLLALLSIGRLPAALVAKTLEQLVLESDLIVVGALSDVRDYGLSGSGVLKVKEVLCGTGVPQELALRWELPTDIEVGGCRPPRQKRPHPDEEDMVWLLVRSRKKRAVRVEDYGRRRPLSEKGSVVQLLEEMPVLARRSLSKGGWGGNTYIDLVFRNVTERPVQIPKFAASHGRLILAPGAGLVLTKSLEGSTEVRVNPIRGKVRSEDKELTFTVPARSEHKVTFKPSRIYRLEKGTFYRFSFTLEGFPSVKDMNRAHFYTRGKKRK